MNSLVSLITPYRTAKFALRGIAVTALALAATAGTAIEPAALVAGLEQAQLRITTQAGRTIELRAYIARTAAQQAQGLMHVRAMAADEGMVFIYPRPRVISMWMKNTYIPLDMLFADTRGQIVNMHAGAMPHDTRIISSGNRASMVVELNAGSIAAYGIATGDSIRIIYEPAQPEN